MTTTHETSTNNPTVHFRRRRVSFVAAIAAGVASVLVLAGCSAGATDPGSSATATGLSDASVKTLASYTGSTAGKADDSLAPVTWGYVNQQGGAQSYPQYTDQLNLLVDTVNSKLGGIGGHPLKLDSCFVVSADEEGQTCGQQFINNKDISAVLQFPLINGDATFHKVIDPTGIPVFGPLANQMEDAVSTNGFYSSGSNFSFVPITVGYVADTVKAKTVAIIGVEGNGISQIVINTMKASFEGAGLTVKVANVSATSSDVTAPLIAAGVTDADAIVGTLPTSSLCVNVANALQSLGAGSKPVVALAACATDDVKNVLGDFPKWTFIQPNPNVLAKPLDEREATEVAVAKDVISALGQPSTQIVDAEATLEAFVSALTVVNKAGGVDATTATIKTSALEFTGPLFLGPEKVGWNTIPGLPAIPSLSQRVYTYQGNDTWVDSGDGWFAVDPSKIAGPPSGPSAP